MEAKKLEIERLKEALNDENLMKVTTLCIKVGNSYMITDRSGSESNLFMPINETFIRNFIDEYHHVYQYFLGQLFIIKGDVDYHLVNNKGNRKVLIFIL